MTEGNAIAKHAVEALRQQKTDVANAAMEDAVRLMGNDSNAYTRMAKELIQSGNAIHAVRLLEKATQQATISADPLLWATLAQAYHLVGNEEQKEQAEQQAQERAKAVEELIGKFQPAKNGDLSVELRNVVQRLFQAGSYYSDIVGEGQRSFAVLREALRLLPDNPFTLNALGYTLADKGTAPEHFQEAVQLTRQAAEKMPENGEVLDSYGWALYKTGEIKAAKRVLRDALSLDPNVPEIHYHMGVVLQESGDTAGARLEYERAIRLRPDYAEAEKALKALPNPKTEGESKVPE
jgi:tetratricopeptide (TPR) repeat protein